MSAHRIARVVTLAAALVPLAGCAYLRDRGRDLTDVVDVKGGVGGYGLGAKVRATEFVGTGVGYGAVYDTTEKLGRPWYEGESGFIGLGIVGFDGQGRRLRPGEGFEISLLGLRVQNETAPRPWTWFRFGGEIVLPFVRGGLFVNLGEFVDFLAGLATLDPVCDDGLPLGTPLVVKERAGESRGEEPQRADQIPPDAK